MGAAAAQLYPRPPESWLAEMGAGAVDVALLIPELRQYLPQAPPELGLIDEQTRFRLFESITNFWIRAALDQPLVLVLDDLHWAGIPSLLLQFVVRELRDSPMLILGTYRDVEVSRDHPLSRTVAELSRARSHPPFFLTGLNQGDATRLMALAIGQTPPEPLVTDIMRQTAGNPFFITELMHLRTRSTRDDAAEIPHSVRGAIRLRLDRLTTDCNRVLEAAAFIGRDFSLGLLLRLVWSHPRTCARRSKKPPMPA